MAQTGGSDPGPIYKRGQHRRVDTTVSGVQRSQLLHFVAFPFQSRAVLHLWSNMFAVYLIAAVLIAQTQSAAIPESETVPIETVIIETKENKEAKSSVDTVDFALLEYTEKDHAKDIDSYLDTAVQADKFGCGSRLICELHRRAESELLPEEVLLRSMFDGKPLAVSSDGPKVAKGRGVFQYAAFIGSTAKNSETCSRAFSRCPFDSDTILIVFRAIGSSPALKSLQHPFPSHKLQPPKEVTSA